MNASPLQSIEITSAVSGKARLGAMLCPLFALCLLTCVGCGFPHDPEQTLSHVQNHVLRVGVVEQGPWAYRNEQGNWQGPEVALVEQFARELHAEVRWIAGGESELIQALKRFELDLVIGGLTDEAAWSSEVGLSAAFCSTRVSLGVRPGETPPGNLTGASIAALPGSLAAALAKEEGAEVQYTRDLAAMPIPIAAESWRLAALGRIEVGEPWEVRRHVWAVPPGENGWLLYLDRFLPEASADFARQLADAERSRAINGQNHDSMGRSP